jgi:hypothetical protein
MQNEAMYQIGVMPGFAIGGLVFLGLYRVVRRLTPNLLGRNGDVEGAGQDCWIDGAENNVLANANIGHGQVNRAALIREELLRQLTDNDTDVDMDYEDMDYEDMDEDEDEVLAIPAQIVRGRPTWSPSPIHKRRVSNRPKKSTRNSKFYYF